MPGRRLDQVDATRPIKQAGVISTHVLLFFAPSTAAFTSGVLLTLLHVSRDAFFFISACMLAYAYADLNRTGLRRFYWRRFVAVGIPYLCWTAVYYLYTFHSAGYASTSNALWGIPHMLYTGYYHLYFLLVIMQFYLVFPLLVVLLRRTRGHHGLIAAAVVIYQFVWATLMHWDHLPVWLSGAWGQRLLSTYVIYLVGGAIIAFHLNEAHEWVTRHWKTVVALTVLAAIGAEIPYVMTAHSWALDLGYSSDAFQPGVIPFNVGAIACLYLIGVWLTRPERSRRVRAVVRSGADNAYGVYLAQMIFINGLVWLGWEKMVNVMPWQLLLVMTVVIVYTGSFALTCLLARTPLSVALTGRQRAPWPWQTRIRRSETNSDTRVDRAERPDEGRHCVPRGGQRKRGDDVRGPAAVGVGVGAATD
jgi:peptidoglycan/LPS O-acetylase OafA/YrhL